MSKRRKWLIVLAGAVLASALTLLLTHEREPSYQGKSLNEWVQVYATITSNEEAELLTNREGAEALRHIGTNALPYLLKWIAYDRAQHRVKVAAQSFVQRLPDSFMPPILSVWSQIDLDNGRAECAAQAFAALGDMARPAIPELTKLMNSPEYTNASRRAVMALGRIGKDALPVLVAQLTATNAPNRANVAIALEWSPALRTNRDVVVPLLIRCLEDGDERVAWMSALALGRMVKHTTPAPAVILPTITNWFRADVPPELRARATYVLSYYGDQAKPFVPILLEATADQAAVVRNAATNALEKIAPEALTNTQPQ